MPFTRLTRDEAADMAEMFNILYGAAKDEMPHCLPGIAFVACYFASQFEQANKMGARVFLREALKEPREFTEPDPDEEPLRPYKFQGHSQ